MTLKTALGSLVLFVTVQSGCSLESECYETCHDDDCIARCDTDDDGLRDGLEVLYGTDPLHVDTDGDLADDGVEIELGLDPTHPDTDLDGFADGEEILWGSNPHRPDTDGDGWFDGDEVACGSSPLDKNRVCPGGPN